MYIPLYYSALGRVLQGLWGIFLGMLSSRDVQRFFAGHGGTKMPGQRQIGLLLGQNYAVFYWVSGIFAGLQNDIQCAVPHGDSEVCAGGGVIGDHFARHKRFNLRLEVSLERSCTVDGIVGGVYHEVLCVLRDGQLQLLILHAAGKVCNLQIHDAVDVFTGQRLIEDDLVQSVKELGTEAALEQLADAPLGVLGDFTLTVDAVEDNIGAEVGGEDEDGILEVYRSALRIGDPAVIKNL